VEDRPRFRGEGALAVEDFQLPLQEAIGFVCATVASVNRGKREAEAQQLQPNVLGEPRLPKSLEGPAA
jgi:hypothetical protein